MCLVSIFVNITQDEIIWQKELNWEKSSIVFHVGKSVGSFPY